MTKERPIIFSAPMVRAILDGRKTQTRRVFKDRVSADCVEIRNYPARNAFMQMFAADKRGSLMPKAWDHRCPYGVKGDRLWVKETFVRVPGCPETLLMPSKMFHGQTQYSCVYRESCLANPSTADFKPMGGWKPSIFMPRWASRLLLEVHAVRVERVQDISPEDARAEGCGTENVPWKAGHEWSEDSWVATYGRLWDSIHGAGSWALNPWVWVIEFRKLP